MKRILICFNAAGVESVCHAVVVIFNLRIQLRSIYTKISGYTIQYYYY